MKNIILKTSVKLPHVGQNKQSRNKTTIITETQMGITTGGRHIALSHKLSEHSANESFTANSQEATTFNKWIMVKTVRCEAHTKKKNNNILHCVTFTTNKSKQLRNSSVYITEQLCTSQNNSRRDS